MALNRVLTSPETRTSLEEQLNYLYKRRLVLEDLIGCLERYSRCADQRPARKGASRVLSSAPLAENRLAL